MALSKSEFQRRMAAPRVVDCLLCKETFELRGPPATKRLCKTCRPKWEADRKILGRKKPRKRKKRAKAQREENRPVSDVQRRSDVGGANVDERREPTEVVSEVQAGPQKGGESTPPARVEIPQGPARGEFVAACELITGPEQKIPREGFRLGILGATGSGKTTLQRAFLQERTDRLTLIHDEKVSDPQFAGAVVERFEQAPDDAQTLVFHGDVFAGRSVPVEYMASGALHICRATRQPLRVVVDELDKACTDGGMKFSAPSLAECFTQGRQMGLSVIWSTQAPQRAPLPAVDQASALALCRLGPRALNYLDERLRFDKDFLAIIPQLANFEFVLWVDGMPWDRKVYTAPFVNPPISKTPPRLVAPVDSPPVPSTEESPDTQGQGHTAETLLQTSAGSSVHPIQ